MARIKIRKKKKGEPEWLVQRKLAKQRKYDRKVGQIEQSKYRESTNSTMEDL